MTNTTHLLSSQIVNFRNDHHPVEWNPRGSLSFISKLKSQSCREGWKIVWLAICNTTNRVFHFISFDDDERRSTLTVVHLILITIHFRSLLLRPIFIVTITAGQQSNLKMIQNSNNNYKAESSRMKENGGPLLLLPLHFRPLIRVISESLFLFVCKFAGV